MIASKDNHVKILVDVAGVLATSLDLEQTMEEILGLLARHLEMKRGTITLVDPVTNELTIEVAHGLTKKEKERGHYKIGEGVTGKVVETGRPMVIQDIESEPLFLNKTQARQDLKERKFAFLCVPILVGGRAIGALSVDHLFRAGSTYEEDIKLLTIIAAMIGQTVRVRELAEKEKQAVVAENVKLKQELKGKYKIGNIIFTSKVMEKVLDGAMQVAQTSASVLITGESGTGKELVASAIHYASPRAEKPFIKVACAALPENLLEAELFGYERGAFTGAQEKTLGRFELANGGTLFLDEIGDLTPATQVKLLRVLQEKEFERLGGAGKTIKVDVRVICATHRDLPAMVKAGKFRSDLFYRINVFPLGLPPLRERKEDIPLMVAHFTHKFNRQNDKKIEGMNQAAIGRLLSYDWPGNVRELENVIEHAVILCQNKLIGPQDLPAPFREITIDVEVSGASLPEMVETLEKQKIKEALIEHKTQRNAAKALGLTERMFGYKRQKYGL